MQLSMLPEMHNLQKIKDKRKKIKYGNQGNFKKVTKNNE